MLIQIYIWPLERVMPNPQPSKNVKLLLLQQAALKLIDALYKDKELTVTEGVFRISGSKTAVDDAYHKILNLEKNDYKLIADIHLKTGLLKKIIMELSQIGYPIVPNSKKPMKQQMQDVDYKSWVGGFLPIESALLTSFLSLLNSITKAPKTKMTASNLAIVVTPNMFQSVRDSNLSVLTELNKNQSAFITQLIQLNTSMPNNKSIRTLLKSQLVWNLNHEVSVLRTAIQRTHFNLGGFLIFRGGVDRMVDGVLIRVPHRIGKILDAIDNSSYTESQRYTRIQKLAQEAIDAPRAGRYQSTTDFYAKIVNGEFDSFASSDLNRSTPPQNL